VRHLANPIPLPWGGSTSSLTLSPGLNDLLIPRELFLYSPFGQAVLLGRNTSYNTSNGAPPLVGTSEQSYLTGFVGANLMVDLGAYWQNRSIETGTTGNITPLTEAGTAAASNLELQVMAAPSATGSNSGGLPSDPTLYQDAGGNPSAVQSIVTLNVTSTTTLDLLLASLIDNTTGGPNAVNGTFQSVTYQVGFLGLDATIVNAVPNATELNDGLWGPPTSQAPSKQPSSLFGSFWNAVTSFVTNPLGTVLSLMYTVWDAAEAAAVYLDHLVSEANAIGAQIKARTAAAIVHVGRIIANAMAALLAYLYTLVMGSLAAVMNPIRSAAASYVSSVGAATNLTYEDVGNGQPVAPAHALQLMNALSGSILVLGLAVGITVSIVLTLLLELTIAETFLLTILLTFFVMSTLAIGAGLAITAAFSAATTWSMDNYLNRTFNPNGGTLAQQNWAAIAGTAGDMVSLGKTPLAFQLFYKEAAGSSDAVVWPTLALMCDLIALVIIGLTWSSAAAPLIILALVLGLLGLAFSVASLISTEDLTLRPFVAVDAGLSAFAAGTAFYEWHSYL